MGISTRAADIIKQFDQDDVRMGELKKVGAEIKKDHDLALELWTSGKFYPRMVATLIFDKMQLDQDSLDKLAEDMMTHESEQRNQLADWLLANQLMKAKKTKDLLESWKDHPSPVMRRLFWYHQGRLRWTGQTPPDNSDELLDILDRTQMKDEPDVQWAMNFCAGWIGVFDAERRDRCIKLGQTTGLFKDEIVPRNCTPSYLPEFIRIEVGKRS